MKYFFSLILIFCSSYLIAQMGPYEIALEAFEKRDYQVASAQFRRFLNEFPKTTFAEEARFLLGVSYFYIREYDLANEVFSCYLKDSLSPKHFEETVKFKFFIAEKFRCGAKRRIFGLRKLPQWLSAEKEALELYEEVSSILPNSDVAGWSLYRKGCLLAAGEGTCREAVEAYQSAIRRFPRDQVARESYVGISYAYLQESKLEANNPDLLGLAMINLKKFRNDFPEDPLLSIVEKHYCSMEEFYAQGFFEMGEFYERTCHPHAAYIYYATTIREFPGTSFAKKARQHLLEWCEYE